MLDAISDPANDGVVYIAASQGGGKTEILLNAAGFYTAADPAPMLFVTYSLRLAEDLSKDRLAPMIRDTPCLRALVADAKSRSSGNTILHKNFHGGYMTLVGANSPGDLASRPIRVLLFDEIDRYPASAGTEGDPVSIAQVRATAFWNKREIYATSPGHKQLDRSWELWRKTDQREWTVPCPDCDHRQMFRWAQVHWEKDDQGRALPQTAVYVCEKCGSTWDDVRRWKASDSGAYEPTAPFTGWAGFRLSALAVIGRQLSQLVEKWLEAQGNPEQLKVFLNTALTEWWEDPDAQAIEEHVLRRRAQDWSAWRRDGVLVPPEACVLTVGVDVQGNRLEWELVGWGRGEESWSLHYGVIPGDLRQDPNVLLQLDAELQRPWRHARGTDLYVRAACVDAGFAAETVTRFTRPRLRRLLPDGYSQFVFGTIGRSLQGRTVWPPLDPKRSKIGTKWVWVVNVDAAKDQVYGRFALNEAGPGFCHFPNDRGQGYFEQLTAEKSVLKYRAGRPYRAWEPKAKGRANEALDCRVYAYAALCALQSELFGLVLDHEISRVENAVPLSAAATNAAPVHAGRRRGVRSRGIEA